MKIPQGVLELDGPHVRFSAECFSARLLSSLTDGSGGCKEEKDFRLIRGHNRATGQTPPATEM